MMHQCRGLGFLVYAAAACFVYYCVQSNGELVLLVTLTRHGSRAPNPVMQELCPANEANRKAYNVPPGQLTEYGMRQAHKFGEYLRDTYVDTLEFLPPTFGGDGQQTYSSRFMSDQADRCLQTVQATAQGLFPNGTGPPGYPNQPVSVQTEQKQYANLLAAAHGACLPKQIDDNKAFDEGRGAALIEDAKDITDVIAKACGCSVEDYAKANKGKEGLALGIKDVGDMLDFDEQQGLPRLAGVSQQDHESMTTLAFQLLQERYYSSREQVTYWAGDLPLELLSDFDDAAKLHANGEKPKHLYIGYHGHRELLYGFAHLLGWSFDVPGMPRALGTSAIPPTTTMFFELHYHDLQEDHADRKLDDADSSMAFPSSGDGSQGGPARDEDGNVKGSYYVRTYTWTPQFGEQEVVLDPCSSAEAGKGCPVDVLKDAVLDSMVGTGTWRDICHHVPFSEAEVMAQKAVYGYEQPPGEGKQEAHPRKSRLLVARISGVAVAVSAGLVLWVSVLAVKARYITSASVRGEEYEIVP